jgi:hypothetical protein
MGGFKLMLSQLPIDASVALALYHHPVRRADKEAHREGIYFARATRRSLKATLKQCPL